VRLFTLKLAKPFVKMRWRGAGTAQIPVKMLEPGRKINEVDDSGKVPLFLGFSANIFVTQSNLLGSICREIF
jgi:hypothetical protein